MPTLANLYAWSGMMGMPGGYEILIVGAIVLIIFGPKRLPALARSIGESITGFKQGLSEIKDSIETSGQEIASDLANPGKKKVAKKS